MRLVVGNSLSQIQDMTTSEFAQVKNLLSYEVPYSKTRFAWGNKNPKRYLIDKRGFFPSGLAYRLNSLPLTGLVDSRIEPKGLPAPRVMIKGVTPYPEQLEAVEGALKAKGGVIQACTGWGKSVCMALLVSRLNVRTLIVVPNLQLKHQLTSTFTQLFGNLNNIVIENIDSARLSKLTDFDCLILDESHHSAAKTYRKLNLKAWTGIYYRFCFTATSYRSNDEEQILMESVTGPVVYTVTYRQAVQKGCVVPIEAYFYDLPIQKMKGNPKSWAAVYSELIVCNKYRNRLICMLLEATKGIPTLCLVKEIAHGEALSASTGVPFANGEDGLARQRILEFCLGETKALIGTTGVLGEGCDTKPAEWVLLGAGGKSKVQFLQNCGRALRIFPGKHSAKVVLFRDASNPYLLKHFRECVKHLEEEYGVKPAKIEFPKELL